MFKKLSFLFLTFQASVYGGELEDVKRYLMLDEEGQKKIRAIKEKSDQETPVYIRGQDIHPPMMPMFYPYSVGHAVVCLKKMYETMRSEKICCRFYDICKEMPCNYEPSSFRDFYRHVSENHTY